MNIMRNILKEITKDDSEEIPKLKVNVEKAMEYAKWLSYVPTFEKENIAKILEKKADELTDIEIKQLENFKEQQQLAPIFSRYITNECKKEDLLPVYDYMRSNSLDKIIISKLTEEEMKQANRMITDVCKCGNSQIRDLVNNWQEPNAYQALTMLHAYCFHILKSAYGKQSADELDEEIRMTTRSSNAYTLDAYGRRQRLSR